MRRHYFLGMAAGMARKEKLAHTFAVGRKKDLDDLTDYLAQKYGGEEVILTKNGRSGLALALMAYFKKGDKIIVNGFTCYAVYEAVKAAGLEPVFTDINKEDLNFDLEAVAKIANAAGIIVQNTLGNPTDIMKIEKLAKQKNWTIIEDLAHCAGVKYPDGREAGTIGAAAVFSFGKDKSIDTTSGGAVVLRQPCKNTIKAPTLAPRPADHLRARFYPMFGSWCTALTYVGLGGALMRLLAKIHWVERSADNHLDIKRKISKFEAKRALIQFRRLNQAGAKPLRDFYLINNRDVALKELKKAGYYLGGFWYEKPVSPARYYKKVHFPEEKCPNAVCVSQHIINIPNYCTKKELEPARKIIMKYQEGKNGLE